MRTRGEGRGRVEEKDPPLPLPSPNIITAEILPTVALTPSRPPDTRPYGPRVSSAYYRSSVLLNSLTSHLHTPHFFLSFLYFDTFLAFYVLLHLIFLGAAPRTPPPALCLLHLICTVQVLCIHACVLCGCVCVCAGEGGNNYHLEY